MNQRCRVLFVPGSRTREVVETTTWRSSDADVSVGLRRSLPGDVLKKLDVESSTHGELLVAATVATPTAPMGRNTSEPGPAITCECCAMGDGHLWYVKHFGRYLTTMRYAEELYVGLVHPDVVRFTGDPQIREDVRERVCEDVDRVNPHIVVGHSLGSVVAIEALALSGWKPRLLITAGAPLAWPRFKETWSREAGRWLSRKSCDWTNVIDLSDAVTGGQVPPISPYANAQNVVVDNDHYSSFFGPDGGYNGTHSVRHYLRHTAVKDAFLKVWDGEGLAPEDAD
jgi:hypothetical protein